MILQKFGIHHHVFTGTDDPFRNEILSSSFRVLTVKFHQADLADLKCHCLGFFRSHAVFLCQFFRQHFDDSLFAKRQHELDFFLAEETVQDPEIRHPGLYITRFADTDVIGNHIGKFFD